MGNANSTLRWFWYALIGVCLVIALVIWASTSPGRLDGRYDKWVQFGILTLGLFGYLLRWGWRYHKRIRFWRLYLVLFLGHCVVFIPVFSRGRWPILQFAIFGSLETMGLAAFIAWAMGRFLPSPNSPARKSSGEGGTL